MEYDVDAIEQEILEELALENEEVADEVNDETEVDLQEDGETLDSEETEETETEETETQETATLEDDGDSPQHRKFAEMRVANKELQEQLDRQKELLEIVRIGSNFETEEDLIRALMEVKPQLDKQKLGLDDEGYQKHLEIEQQKSYLDQERQMVMQERLQNKATLFRSKVDAVSEQLNIKDDYIFQKLEDNGLDNLEELLLNTNDFDGLLKAILVDEYIEYEVGEKVKKELERGTVETEKIGNVNDASMSFEEKQDKLLEESFKNYVKEQGYDV